MDTGSTTPYAQPRVGETVLDKVGKDHNTLGRSDWANVVI